MILLKLEKAKLFSIKNSVLYLKFISSSTLLKLINKYDT